MVRTYNSKGISVSKCLSIIGLSKNQYYYKSNGKPIGRKPSKSTLRRNVKTGEEKLVCNTEVVTEIVKLKMDPDHANYYRLICFTLWLMGYFINHKKVYRLMHEHLILEDRANTKGRKYVQYRRVAPKSPLEILEMDIKYVWIHGQRRNAYVLTIIDTFTRYVLHWHVGFKMQTEQVQNCWEYVIAHYLQPYKPKDSSVDIEVRSDNGKQFKSKKILEFFEQNKLDKVFIHPYTPEENGHIESFHKTLGKALENDTFENLQSLETRLRRFYTMYNNVRSHGSIKGLPPAIFWALYDKGLLDLKYNDEKRSLKAKLKVTYQEIMGLPKIHKFKYRVNRA